MLWPKKGRPKIIVKSNQNPSWEFNFANLLVHNSTKIGQNFSWSLPRFRLQLYLKYQQRLAKTRPKMWTETFEIAFWNVRLNDWKKYWSKFHSNLGRIWTKTVQNLKATNTNQPKILPIMRNVRLYFWEKLAKIHLVCGWISTESVKQCEI